MMGNSPVLKCQAAPKRAVRAHQEADAQSDATTHMVANSSGRTLQDRSGDASQATVSGPHFGQLEWNSPVCTLRPGEFLFREGDPKDHVYRVETGSICVFANRSEWLLEMEFAFPGDLVGLGHLAHHISNARAVADTRVACLPLSAAEEIAKNDATANQKLTDAIKKEQSHVRRTLVRSGQQNPIARLAAFLVTLSCYNPCEGRDPNVISDALKCGIVANYLALNVDQLAQLLVDLERLQLVAHCPSQGLILQDLDALKRLAAGCRHDGLLSQHS